MVILFDLCELYIPYLPKKQCRACQNCSYRKTFKIAWHKCSHYIYIPLFMWSELNILCAGT